MTFPRRDQRLIHNTLGMCRASQSVEQGSGRHTVLSRGLGINISCSPPIFSFIFIRPPLSGSLPTQLQHNLIYLTSSNFRHIKSIPALIPTELTTLPTTQRISVCYHEHKINTYPRGAGSSRRSQCSRRPANGGWLIIVVSNLRAFKQLT